MTGCPSTSAAVKASSDKLNCTPSLVYHCLRDQAGHLTQKCIKPSWIQKGHCAEYNTVAQRLDAKACMPTRGLCPDKPYLSNDVISFSGCAPTEPEASTINTAISNDTRTDSSDIDTSVVVILIVLLILFVCVVAGVAVFICYRRRQQGNNGTDEENTELLIQNRGNRSEENKKEAHLKKEEESLKYFEYKGTCTKYMLKKAEEHLQKKNNIVIVGKPGCGKTTLAWTVCKQMHGEMREGKRWHVTVSADTESVPDEVDMILLLLDGLFETAWTTAGNVEKILQNVKHNRKKFPTKQVLIMVTISERAYRRIEKYDCIKTLYPRIIINLDEEKNSLTIPEMSKVFETYDISNQNVTEAADYNVLSKYQLDSIYACFQHHNFIFKNFYTIPQLGFPLVASLMALNSAFLGSIDFVKEPIKHILKSIRQLKESGKQDDKNKYCTIVYATFNGGSVDTHNVDEDMLQEIGKHHNIQEPKIDTDFYLLRKRARGVWEFVHDILLPTFLAAYGHQHLEFVTKNCSLDVLLEYSLSEKESTSDKDKLFYLRFGTDHEKTLIKRIIDKDIEIKQHRLYGQSGFQKKYDDMYAEMEKTKILSQRELTFND